jgi:S-formylglutathione hydrolase FrmB
VTAQSEVPASRGGHAVARRRRTPIVVLTAVIAAWLMATPTTEADVRPVRSQQLNERLLEITLHSEALEKETPLRVLLPSGYDPSSGRRYPVLYLLHGCTHDYRSWTDEGAAQEITQEAPIIVVMPDGGRCGFYSDWFNNGAYGPPRWESYHIRELVPWVDRTFPTVAARRGRAVAGLSMGGFGALSYAARHPDLFLATASFSGVADTNMTADWSLLDSGPPGSIWGHRATEEVRWRGHNPWDLALNLRALELTLRTGNGQPGGEYVGANYPIEAWVHAQNVSLHERLDALGIRHLWDDHGAGSHDWPYWQRDLRLTLPDLLNAFAAPREPPRDVDFEAIEPAYEAFGWHVTLERPVLEFSALRDADPEGFRLTGSGTATVVTPARYQPHAIYEITRRTGLHQTVARANRPTEPADCTSPSTSGRRITLRNTRFKRRRRAPDGRRSTSASSARQPRTEVLNDVYPDSRPRRVGA